MEGNFKYSRISACAGGRRNRRKRKRGGGSSSLSDFGEKGGEECEEGEKGSRPLAGDKKKLTQSGDVNTKKEGGRGLRCPFLSEEGGGGRRGKKLTKLGSGLLIPLFSR